MATIGLSHPYVAQYSNTGSSVSYSGGRLLGKATELNIELEDGDSNILYADNAPAESDNQFSGGSLEISTDELRPQALIDSLGVVSEAISSSAVTTPNAAWLVNNDAQVQPYLGFGAVAMRKIDNAIKYVGIVLDKILFSNPNDAITTKGETIEWQTPTLSGQIFLSDKPNHDWRRITTPLNTESEADAAVRQYLNISEAAVTPSLSALTIGAAELSPAFASATTEYTAATSDAADAVTATVSNAGDTVEIEVNGAALNNGGEATWAAGANTVKITVTNSGGAQMVYTVTVTMITA